MEHRNWIAVACAEHVARGRAGGFMQVCHGKEAPLKRLRAGDRVVYYSPTEAMGRGPALQAFTAIGRLREGAPYRFDMGGGFVPWRRDVDYVDARAAAIRPLLDRLEFTRGLPSWGAKFRYGLFSVSTADLQCIAEAMGASPVLLGLAEEAMA